LEAAAVGLWDWNIATGELWWSDNLAEIHGLPPAAFDGTFERFRSFIHPADRDEFDIALRRALDAGEDFTVEFRVLGQDGGVRWIRGQGRVYRDAARQPARVIGIGLDVTGRRQQENALRQLGVIAEASSDAIVAVNRAGVVTAWNPGAEHIYGFTAAEMLGSSLRTIVPPERAGEIERMLERLATGERIANFETERCRKDGTRVTISISNGAILDESGEFAGAVTISRDITRERREADRQQLLAEMGRVLNTSFDADAMLQAVANVAVERFADWCTVHLVQADGVAEPVVVAHATPERLASAGSLRVEFPYVPDAPFGVANVIRTGRPDHVESIADAPLRAATADRQSLDDFRNLGITSVLIVPMIARGTTIGAISLATAESGRRYSIEDRDLAMELARRAALAIDNALLFARVQATERQLRLVADNLPALVSYVDTDLRYRFVNRRYAEWFGRSSDELLNQRVIDVNRTSDDDRVGQQLALAMSGQPVQYDIEVAYPVAGRRHVEVDYVPDTAPDGSVRGVVALVVDVTERERSHRRVAELSNLTAALAGALTEDDVAELIVRLGVAALDGAAGAVLSVDPDGASLTLRAIQGFPGQFKAGDRFPIESSSRFGRALQELEPFLLPTWEERIRELPWHAEIDSGMPRGAFVALPLAVEGRRLGIITIAYANDRVFLREDVDFKMALANVCAQAFDRARIYDAERLARAQAEADRARVTFLADASRILAASFDIDSELDRVMQLAAASLADWCTAHLLEEGGRLRRIGAAHRDPARGEALRRLATDYGTLPEHCWQSVRARIAAEESWFEPSVDPERLAKESLDAGHLALLQELGFAGEIVVPLVAGGRLFGSMTFVRSAASPPFTEADLGLAEELGSRTALAIDNARLLKGVTSSEARYRSLFEGVADALLIVDPAGGVRGGNEAASSLLTVGLGTLVDLPLSSMLMDPSLATALLVDGWRGEFEILRTDGTSAPVEAQSTVVDLPTGRAVLIAMRDVTQRRTLERFQRDFLAMVTHDLRSPLAAIRVQSQLMRRRGQYSEASVDAIVGQTGRIARLINALADLVRMDSGRLDLNRQPVDLVDLARSVAEQERDNAPGREVIVEATGPVVSEWDADRLSQVVSNLIGNALKYSGGDEPVIVTVAARGGEAGLTVSDSGVGIPAEHLSKLFERFYRADMTGAGGLGLGLYIARMLVEAHGGRISATSELGRGSTFTVALPLESAERASTP
jgi:PAS domain S-box-containing protein